MDGISANGAFVYFIIPLFGGIPITQTTVSSLIVTIVICLACVFLGKDLKKRPGKRQVLVEKGVSMLRKMVCDTMGPHNAHWTPFIGTIFLSSLCGSFIGLTGFLRSTTADISCVAVWALMVTFIIWYQNIKQKGFFGWLKGFAQPIFIMAPMNVISEIAQPLAMTFRQFGNLTGGGIITSIVYAALSLLSTFILNLIAKSGWIVTVLLLALGIALLVLRKKIGKLSVLVVGIFSLLLGICSVLHITGLIPNIPIFTYGIPALLSCYFDLFSGFIQAYVFTLLTMVYIGGSLPAPEAQAAA